MYTEDSEVLIYLCNFDSNSVDYNGGAIAMLGESMGITDTNFTSNHISNHGGAIFFQLDSSNHLDTIMLTVSRCTFYNNSAKYGGAISGGTDVFEHPEYLYKGIGNRFSNNRADLGGAIYSNIANIII